MTRRERLEAKLQKRREWAESRRAKSSERFDAARSVTEHIPFGQPILVGHHSEGRHRRALAKSDAAMSKAVEHSSMAKHHENKADGLEEQLSGSVFSDDPDAIEQLQAKIDEAKAKQEQYKAINKIIRRAPRYKKTGEKMMALVELFISGGMAAESAELLAHKTFDPDCMGGVGIPSYKLQNNNANIRRMEARIEDIKRRQARQAKAEESGGVTIERGNGMARVTFAEKPSRDILNSLRAAGFHWGGGCWTGRSASLPECVAAIETAAA